jgi:hypothetical protein
LLLRCSKHAIAPFMTMTTNPTVDM